MALSDEQIDQLIQRHVDPVATYLKLHIYGRAIEAEVNAQNDALIRQLADALGAATTPLAKDRREVLRAITAARAWLEGKP